MSGKIIAVSDVNGLNAALASALGGDTITLAAGNYGVLSVVHKHFAQAVTITGGTFSSVTLYDTGGITLSGTTVHFSPSATTTSNSQAVRVFYSTDIVIDHASITGGPSVNGVPISATKLDATGNVIGLPAGKGVNFDHGSHLTISNSDISGFAKGVVMAGVTDITIAANTIHDLRTTPISGSAESGVTITGNHTWNSNPWRFGLGGDHGDRIHIWTDKTAMSGVSISDNLLEQGTGKPMLGIYLDDNLTGLGFPGAIIANNTIVDGTGQGLRLENVSNAQVTHNTLLWSGTGDAFHNTPRFQIADHSHDIVFTDNTGNVALEAGVYNMTFINQHGTVNGVAIQTAPPGLPDAAAAGFATTAAESDTAGLDVPDMTVDARAFQATADFDTADFDSVLSGSPAFDAIHLNLHAFA